MRCSPCSKPARTRTCRTTQSATPLHHATLGARKRSLAIVLALLDAGADPNVQNNAGVAPLHHTLNCRTNESAPAVMVALLDGGADPNAPIRLPGVTVDIPPWFVAAALIEESQCPVDVVSLLRGLKH